MTNFSTNAASGFCPPWPQLGVLRVGYQLGDSEEIELYPAPCPSISNRDRLNDWIVAGNKLRQTKPAPYPRKHEPKLVRSTNLPKRRKRHTGNNFTNGSPCSCSYGPTKRLSEPVLPTRSSKNNRIKSRIKSDNQTKCTSRIAQLATPSKRHCLETWRNNSYILPDCMIDRLKQYVMDQRPIVQISEAIDSFQRRKTRIRKKITKSSFNRLLNQKPKSLLKTISLCLIFSQKVALMLSKPLNIILSTDFQYLAGVVSDDIAKITNTKNEALGRYRTIHTEVTNKVTVWIADILNDLEHKLLEEELRDLDEEEGPALDFLDAIVDKVLDICVPKTAIINIETDSIYSDRIDVDSIEGETWQDSNDKLIGISLIGNEISESTANIHEASDDEELPDKEFFENEILNAMNYIFEDSNHKRYFENEILDAINYIFEDSKYKTVIEDNYLQSDDKLTDAQYFKNEINNIISTVCKGDITKINNDEEKDENETEASETSEGSKKVIFSFSDMEDFDDINNDSISEIVQHTLPGDKDNKKRSIFFAEPNQRLLSEADEVWPQESIITHKMRPSASVTKSILSLGDLWEKDEKYITPSQADGSINLDKFNVNNHQNIPFTLNSEPQNQDNQIIVIASQQDIMQNIKDVPADKTDPAYVELQDERADSLCRLLNILLRDEKILSDTNAYIADNIALLHVDVHSDKVIEPMNSSSEKGYCERNVPMVPEKVTTAVISLLNILQNDKNLIREEVNEALADKLNLLEAELPDRKSTGSIRKLFNILKAKEKLLTPADAKILISEILSLLNIDLEDDNVAKSIESLVTDIQNNVNNLPNALIIKKILNIFQDPSFKFIEKRHQPTLEIKESPHNLIDSGVIASDTISLIHKADNIQSRIEKVIKTVTLVTTETMLVSVDSKPTNKDIPVQERLKVFKARNEIKTKNKGIATDPTVYSTQLNDDWKARFNIAPSWIIRTNVHGEPSAKTVPIEANENPAFNLIKSDVLNWCKDLDKGFKNLEIWSDWLRSTCKETASLLKTRNACNYCYNKQVKWIKLQSNITKDAVLWRKMYKNTNKTFKRFQKYYAFNNKIASTKWNPKCVCKTRPYLQ